VNCKELRTMKSKYEFENCLNAASKNGQHLKTIDVR
jgi:hypothetical protein